MNFLDLHTKTQKGIFCLYITLWISYGLLNERAKLLELRFDSSTAVLSQSIIKLVLAMYLSIEEIQNDTKKVSNITIHEGKNKLIQSIYYLYQNIKDNKIFFIYYMIPASLYAIYDILSYINLRAFDASAYFLLLQFRIVITALLHQKMFQLKLNRNQWISLFLVTIGCLLKTMADNKNNNITGLNSYKTEIGFLEFTLSFLAYGLLLLQILASTSAGIYNEMLLKKKKNLSIHLQNIFMYFDTLIIVSISILFLHTNKTNDTENGSVSLLSMDILPMIIIMSFIGLVTSAFLRHLDSIRKAIASALELMILPILSYIFFNKEITFSLFFSVIFVGLGVYYYSLPVKTQNQTSSPSKNNSPCKSVSSNCSSPGKDDLENMPKVRKKNSGRRVSLNMMDDINSSNMAAMDTPKIILHPWSNGHEKVTDNC